MLMHPIIACYDDGKSHDGYTISLGKDNGSFCAKLGFDSGKLTILMEDNISTIQMIEGKINHRTVKHINTKFNHTN